MRVLTRREELLSQARRHPEAVVDQLLTSEQQVKALLEKVRVLEGRLALDSSNSSQPPASDGLAKTSPRNLRKKTGRKPGGQPGQPGHTLNPVKKPDHQKVHRLDRCPCGQCGGVSLQNQPVLDYERRQVFDLPPLRLEVTEHRAEIKICPISNLTVKASFPAEVEAPIQYGPNFRGLTLYLFNQQLLPFDRLRQTCLDLFAQPLSLGTVSQTNERAYQTLAPVESAIARALIQAPVVNVDESGLRVAGNRGPIDYHSLGLSFSGCYLSTFAKLFQFYSAKTHSRGIARAVFLVSYLLFFHTAVEFADGESQKLGGFLFAQRFVIRWQRRASAFDGKQPMFGKNWQQRIPSRQLPGRKFRSRWLLGHYHFNGGFDDLRRPVCRRQQLTYFIAMGNQGT